MILGILKIHSTNKPQTGAAILFESSISKPDLKVFVESENRKPKSNSSNDKGKEKVKSATKR